MLQRGEHARKQRGVLLCRLDLKEHPVQCILLWPGYTKMRLCGGAVKAAL